jgi:magnesium-transporting ATPase (P-type)
MSATGQLFLGIDGGGSKTLVALADRHATTIAVEDEIRPESKEAIDALHSLGIRVAMITGDSQAVAESVARRLDLDEVAAQVLPGDKAAAVKRFQARHGLSVDGAVKDQTLKSRLHRGRLMLRTRLRDFTTGLSLHRPTPAYS